MKEKRFLIDYVLFLVLLREEKIAFRLENVIENICDR